MGVRLRPATAPGEDRNGLVEQGSEKVAVGLRPATAPGEDRNYLPGNMVGESWLGCARPPRRARIATGFRRWAAL